LDIYVYSDESGVFDKAHNDIFVFGGIIFFSKKSKDIYTRKYIAAERVIRWSEKIPPSIEVKATTISNKSKGKLYRSLNQVHKFGVIINQQNVLDRIFASKKDKQRYLLLLLIVVAFTSMLGGIFSDQRITLSAAIYFRV
jgi:hypothetical protein